MVSSQIAREVSPTAVRYPVKTVPQIFDEPESRQSLQALSDVIPMAVDALRDMNGEEISTTIEFPQDLFVRPTHIAKRHYVGITKAKCKFLSAILIEQLCQAPLQHKVTSGWLSHGDSNDCSSGQGPHERDDDNTGPEGPAAVVGSPNMTTNDRTQTDETGGQKPTDEESRAVRHFDAEARLRGELDDTVVTTAELDTHLFAATSLAEVKRETGHGLCCYEPANKDGETILREPDNYSARIEVDSQHVFNAGDLR